MKLTVALSDLYGGCWVAHLGAITVYDPDRAEAVACAVRVQRWSARIRRAQRRVALRQN